MIEKIKSIFPKGKKGFNDVVIITAIISVFLLSAILIPIVQGELTGDRSTYDSDSYIEDVQDDGENVNVLSAFNILITVGRLAFFDIGGTLGLPIFISIIYKIMTITLIYTLARNIWRSGA